MEEALSRLGYYRSRLCETSEGFRKLAGIHLSKAEKIYSQLKERVTLKIREVYLGYVSPKIQKEQRTKELTAEEFKKKIDEIVKKSKEIKEDQERKEEQIKTDAL